MSFIKWNLFRKQYNATDFILSELRETTQPLENPARGWYRIVYFSAKEDPGEKLAEYGNFRVDDLELVILDISTYREERISDEGMENIRKILDWYRDNAGEIILRVVYDHEGKAPEKEPFFFEYVTKHMAQIGDVVKDYSEVVFVYQGLLVGNWGEMHTSRFLDEKKIKELSDIFEEKTKGKIYHAVRRPVQWRRLQDEQFPNTDLGQLKLGLFDDGILGSESHLGTFGNEERRASDWSRAWRAIDELDFEDQLGRYVPNGGEALFPQDRENMSLQESVEVLRKMHITYLNRYYEPKILENWGEQIWRMQDAWYGKSGLEYIGAHLGYRYIIRSIKVSCEKKKTREYVIKLRIQNDGFAGCYQQISLKLGWMDQENRAHEDILIQNMMDWNGQTEMEWEHSLEGPVGEIKLWLERMTDGRVIRFANPTDEKGKVLLGCFLPGEK